MAYVFPLCPFHKFKIRFSAPGRIRRGVPPASQYIIIGFIGYQKEIGFLITYCGQSEMALDFNVIVGGLRCVWPVPVLTNALDLIRTSILNCKEFILNADI